MWAIIYQPLYSFYVCAFWFQLFIWKQTRTHYKCSQFDVYGIDLQRQLAVNRDKSV